VDADPNPSLTSALGIEEEITPVSEMKDLIAERTGAEPGSSWGQIFKLNPKVDDILEEYSHRCCDNLDLLVVGTIEAGGSGCFCPESAFLKSLMGHLMGIDKLVIVDLEAGVENFGRAVAKDFDLLLIIVEPGLRSVEVAERISDMAEDIKIRKVYAVLNKVKREEDVSIIEQSLCERRISLLSYIPYSDAPLRADLLGKSPYTIEDNSFLIRSIEELKSKVYKLTENVRRP
jgi:CO dehydrogenase maturation factor